MDGTVEHTVMAMAVRLRWIEETVDISRELGLDRWRGRVRPQIVLPLHPTRRCARVDGMDPDQGGAKTYCVANNIRGSSAPCSRLAIPDCDKQIAVTDDQSANGVIATRLIVPARSIKRDNATFSTRK